jgi:serralysin
MTYRSYVGAATNSLMFEALGAPQSYMMLDIAALQQMYGADYGVNAGNTVYKWAAGSGRTLVNGQVAIDPGGNRILATVWDGGGRDTYDLSAYKTGVSVDLRPGQHSVFSGGQLADLGGGPNGGHARGNIFNALLFDGNARSLIENATGGAGHDRLIGNAAANRLEGGGAKDVIRGLGGADMLVGGPGADVFVFGAVGESTPARMDRISPGGGAAAFQGPGTAAGDRIDLHLIDADGTLAGNQAFVLGGRGAGHLWLKEVGTVTFVGGNTDRDATIEFQLAIEDGGARPWAYTADDFLL